MKKILIIIALLLFGNVISHAETPGIKVDALECIYSKNDPRIYNRFIFFSDDQKEADLKFYENVQNQVNIDTFKVNLDLDAIYLRNENYSIWIYRSSGKLLYWNPTVIGSSNGGVCKEFKKDIDLEKEWNLLIDKKIQKKKDKIIF